MFKIIGLFVISAVSLFAVISVGNITVDGDNVSIGDSIKVEGDKVNVGDNIKIDGDDIIVDYEKHKTSTNKNNDENSCNNDCTNR